MKTINSLNTTSTIKINSPDRIKNMINRTYKNRDEKWHTNSTQVISWNLKLENTFRTYDDHYDFYFNNEQVLDYNQNEDSFIKFIDLEKIWNLKNFNNLLTWIDDENNRKVFFKYLIKWGENIDETSIEERFDNFYNNIILNWKKEDNILWLLKEDFLKKFISKYEEEKWSVLIDFNDYLEWFWIKEKFKYWIFDEETNSFLETWLWNDNLLSIWEDLMTFLHYDIKDNEEDWWEELDTIDILEKISNEKWYKIKILSDDKIEKIKKENISIENLPF